MSFKNHLKASRALPLWAALGAFVLFGCGSSSSSIEEVPADFVHSLPPTDEMMQFARQQCKDNPDQAQGIVELTGEDGIAVSKAVVDC